MLVKELIAMLQELPQQLEVMVSSCLFREVEMNDLVKGLRGELLDCKCNAYCYGECACNTTWPESLCRDAADHIEQLEKENDQLRHIVETEQDITEEEALLREIDRELDDVEYLGSYVDGIKALKAEIKQLKSQLKEK